MGNEKVYPNILCKNKIIFNGCLYMNEKQTAILKEKVLEQKHGIVLIFSAYRDGEAKDWDYSFTFIPKAYINLANGSGTFHLMGGANGLNNTKYIYIYDDKLVGNKVNNNDGYVLRWVIGV